MLGDRLGQLVERFLIEMPARLLAVRLDVERAQHGGAAGAGLGVVVGQQRVQPAAKPFFRICSRHTVVPSLPYYPPSRASSSSATSV